MISKKLLFIVYAICAFSKCLAYDIDLDIEQQEAYILQHAVTNNHVNLLELGNMQVLPTHVRNAPIVRANQEARNQNQVRNKNILQNIGMYKWPEYLKSAFLVCSAMGVLVARYNDLNNSRDNNCGYKKNAYLEREGWLVGMNVFLGTLLVPKVKSYVHHAVFAAYLVLCFSVYYSAFQN